MSDHTMVFDRPEFPVGVISTIRADRTWFDNIDEGDAIRAKSNLYVEYGSFRVVSKSIVKFKDLDCCHVAGNHDIRFRDLEYAKKGLQKFYGNMRGRYISIIYMVRI